MTRPRARGGWGSWQWGQVSRSSRSQGPRFKSQLSSFLALRLWASGFSALCLSLTTFSPFCRVESSVNAQPCSPSLSLTPQPSGSASTQDPRAQRVKSGDSGLRLTGHFARFSSPWTSFTQSLPRGSSKALPDLPIPSLPSLFLLPVTHSAPASLASPCPLQT